MRKKITIKSQIALFALMVLSTICKPITIKLFLLNSLVISVNNSEPIQNFFYYKLLNFFSIEINVKFMLQILYIIDSKFFDKYQI